MKTEMSGNTLRIAMLALQTGVSCCGPSACCGAPVAAEEASGRSVIRKRNESYPGVQLGTPLRNPTRCLPAGRGDRSGPGWVRASTASWRQNRSVRGKVIGVDMTPEMIQRPVRMPKGQP